MTSQENTFRVLNASFVINSTIDQELFIESLICHFDNTEKLVKRVDNFRGKSTSVAWETFISFTNELLRDYHNGYTCSSEQLKNWLSKNGKGYELLNPLTEYIQAEREAYKEELLGM